ncbi:hypothetical protein BFF78_03395 [Streptomyces fodineus]|uniref:Uncharacterized protein n=1 Tax=Streptomyces fodineus TaxID=1904616 RepID=A0A1D7Y3T0_9ACTN|nr:hypothetical protein BFF78_03395 [Streptomyces fodineus]
MTAEQRREVLRTTALPSGYALLGGFEQWGRLNLFAAADGYGAFDSGVSVTLVAAAGGFCGADAWRNDIDGRGGLTKRGAGAVTPTGRNRYTGGTVPAGGTSAAGSEDALGHGDVRVVGGRLRVTRRLRVRGGNAQDAGTLEVTLRTGGKAPLTTDRAGGRARRRGGVVAAAGHRAAAGRGQHPAGRRRAPVAQPVHPDRGELPGAAGRTRVHGRRSAGTTREAVTPRAAGTVRQ